MSEIVIREAAPNVWIFSRPFALFGWIQIGGRSTAIKLNDGGVWVMVSSPLSAETKAKLDELGPVKYIIGVNAVHHLYLSEYKQAYPEAKLIAPKSAARRCEDKALVFDGAWGDDSADTKYGFEDEIEACYFAGFKNRDVAFLHKASGTLIQADLLTNLPGREQYSKCTTSSGLFPWYGSFGKPSGWIQNQLSGAKVDKPEQMKADVKTVAAWSFKRIIPCHGDLIEEDGNAVWRETWKAFL